jgi:hypothetical protein
MGRKARCQKCGTDIYTNIIYHPGDSVLCDECEQKLTDALNAMIEPGFTKWLFAFAKTHSSLYHIQYRHPQAKHWRLLDRRAYTLEEAQARIAREQVEDNTPFEYRIKEAVV